MILAESTTHRPVLRPRVLAIAVIAMLSCVAAFAFLRADLPQAWQTPGSAPLYLVGVAGTAALLVPFLFAITKRCALSDDPPAWFVAHVLSSIAGLALLFVHSGFEFDDAQRRARTRSRRMVKHREGIR